MASFIDLNIGADTSEALKKVNQLGSEVDNVTKKSYKINVDADTSKANNQVNDLNSRVQKIQDKKINLELDAKNTINQINEVQKKLTNIEKTKTKVNIDLTKAESDIEDFKKHINDILEKEAKLEINSEDAQKEIDKIQKQLAKVNDKKVKLETDLSTSEKDIKYFSNLLDGLNNKKVSIDLDSDKAQKELKSLVDKLEETNKVDIELDVDKLANQFNKTKNELSSLKDMQELALAQLKIDGKEATKEYADLQNKLVETTKKYQEFQDATKEPIKTEGFADIKAKFDAIGELGANFTELSDDGLQLADTMKQVSAQTGLTGSELEKLQIAGTDAFKKGIGENVSEAVKAIATGRQLLSGFLDTEQIDRFVIGAGGIAKTFDEDINNIISKSRTFISNFGLNGEEAFNLISYAAQKSNGDMGDVLDTLDEYSQLVKQAGFNAEEFTGILTVGMENGSRNMDKLADSIKETQIRLNAGDITNALKEINSPITDTINNIVQLGESGTLSVKDVLKQSEQAIKTAFDAGEISSAMRDKLNVALSGTMAEDIGGELYTKIFSADINAEVIKSKAKKAGELIGNSLTPSNYFAQFQRELEAVWSGISASLAPVTSAVGSVLTNVAQVAPALSLVNDLDFGKLTKSFTEISGTVLSTAKNIVTTLVPSLGAQTVATETATAGQVGLNTAMIANPIGLIVAAIIALIGTLYLLYQNVDEVRIIFDSIWDVAVDVFNGIVEAISPVFETFKAFGSYIWNYITLPFQIVWGVIKGVIENFKGIGSSTDSIGGKIAGLKPIFEAIFGTLTKVFNFFSAILSKIINVIVAVLTPVISFVINAAISGFQLLFSVAEKVFTAIYDFIKPIIDGIGSIAGAVSEFFDGIFGSAEDKAKESADKIKSDFENALNNEANLKIKATLDLENSANQLDNAKQKVTELQNKLKDAVNSGKKPEDIKAIEKELQKSQNEVDTLTSQIANDYPNAIKGAKTETETLADGTTKIKTSYDINTDAVRKYTKEVKNAYNPEIQKNQKAFSDGIKSQANEYNKAKARLAELQNKGGLTQSDLEEIEKQKAKINDLGKTITENLKKGKSQGYEMTDAVGAVAGAFGKTTDEVGNMITEQKKADKETTVLKNNAEGLATIWGTIGQAMSNANKKNVDAISLITIAQQRIKDGLNLNDFIREYAVTDKATIDLLTEAWNEGFKDLDKYKKEAKKLANQQLKDQNTVAKATKGLTAESIQAEQDKTKETAKQEKLINLEIAKNEQIRNAESITNELEKNKKLIEINRKYELDKLKIEEENKKLINDKEKQINQKFNDELFKLEKENRIKLYEQLLKVNENKAKEYEKSLTIGLDLYNKLAEKSALNEQQLTEFRAKSLELYDLKQKAVFDDLINNNQDYLDKQKELQNKVAIGELDGAAAVKLLNDYKQSVIKNLIETNDLAKQINENNLRERADYELNLDKDLENKKALNRINGIKDRFEREREYNKLQAKITYESDLKNAKDNAIAKDEALRKYNETLLKIDTDYANKTKTIYEKLKDTVIGSFSSMFDGIQAVSNQDIIKQAKADLETIKQSEQDLIEQRNQGSITNEEYQKKFIELEKQKAEAIKNSSLSQIDWIKTLNKALIQSFQNIASAFSEQSKQIYTEFQASLTKQGEAKAKFGEDSQQYNDAVNESAEISKKAWGSVGIATGAIFAQMLVDGKSFLKSMVMATLSGLKAIIPIFIAEIYANEIKEKSFWGIATATALTAILTGLVSVAESAVSQINFAEGGYYEGGNFPTGRISKHIQVANVGETGEPEFVFNPIVTRKSGKELEYINDNNMSLQEWGIKNYGMQTDKITKKLEDIEQVLKTTKLVHTAHNYHIQATNNVMNKMKSIDYGAY